jgi:diacylglycerol kinase
MILLAVARKFRYALRGLSYVVKRELSFRLELVAAVLAGLVAWYFDFNLLAWAILILISVVILTAEIFNTVLERLFDLVEPRLSLHIAFLKDLLAAAVGILALGSLAIGVCLLAQAL